MHKVERKQPIRVGGSPLCDVVSSFLCHTHTDGKDKAPGMARPFMFASLCWRAHPQKHSLAERKKSSLTGSHVSRGITVLGSNAYVHALRRKPRVQIRQSEAVYFKVICMT